MNETDNPQLNEALRLAKAGQKARAKALLAQLVKQEPRNARAWYLLSQVVEDREQIIFCLEKALALQPENIPLKERIERLKKPQYNDPDQLALIQKKKKRTRDFLGALALVIGIIVCTSIGMSVFSSNSGERTPEPTATMAEQDAFIMCLQFVRDRLKSPGSAEFPYSGEAQTSRNGDQFAIQSYVDSQNSFGASIRTRWTCTIRHIGNDNWKLINLQFSDW